MRLRQLTPLEQHEKARRIKETEAMLAAPICYASGETPERGDVIAHQRLGEAVGSIALSKEEQQLWVVTGVYGDMVKCKCQDAENWKQAHYVNQFRLVHRKRPNKS